MPIYSFEGCRPEIAATAYVSPTATIIGHVVIGERCRRSVRGQPLHSSAAASRPAASLLVGDRLRKVDSSSLLAGSGAAALSVLTRPPSRGP
ncbi:MAG: hypothetical protein MUE73_07160 [Planctomycetes bacterium]|jgi:hypothetical protein|nr:hypothetical protein [Planctomycetota bacterium]